MRMINNKIKVDYFLKKNKKKKDYVNYKINGIIAFRFFGYSSLNLSR
jgi:hypothetical protein